MEPKTLLRCDYGTQFAENYNHTPQHEIRVRVNNESVVIPVGKITYLEAIVNYTLVYTNSNEKYLSSRTIKHFERLLDKNMFVRVHKSHIVNVGFIKQLDIHKKNGEIELQCGKQLEISRRKLKEIIELNENGKFIIH